MHVAVAIVGFRNAPDVERCLEALSRSEHRDFEVVICENGGDDACSELAARLPRALPGGQPVRAVCAGGNLGYAGGVNRCLRESPDADAWWVLNPDTEPHPGALAAMVARLEEGDCDAVGAVLYRPTGQVQTYGGRWRSWLARAEAIGHGRSLDEPVDRDRVEREQSFINGASMLVSRRFLELNGPMREEYFLYCEEVEWCLRALENGLRLGFAPDALVRHDQGSTTGSGKQVAGRGRLPIYLDERNKMLVTRDHYPAAMLPAAAAGALLMLFARYARRGAWRQLGFGLSGWLAGLRNQRGKPDWVTG